MFFPFPSKVSSEPSRRRKWKGKKEEKESSLFSPLPLVARPFFSLATMLSTKGKPAPLPSSPLLSSKLKQASLDDDAPVSRDATATHNGAAAGEERQEMKQFWEEHSKTATVEEMMLDSKASEIDLQERPEVRAAVAEGEREREF